MFDLIATRYDMINRVLAVGMDIGWRKRMVQKIQESLVGQDSSRLLDIATGTADVALLLADAIPTATILGVDPSQNMLSVGDEKIRARGYANERIQLRQISDRQNFTEFAAPGSFDAATIAFGIRNVPDRAAALCEIRHVLKEGGRFCVLEFSEPDDSFGALGRLARLFIRHVVPFLGGVLSAKPREYWHLQSSIQNFPSPNEFGRLMEQLDCARHQGTFRMEELIQMNFGSVQLYVATAVNS